MKDTSKQAFPSHLVEIEEDGRRKIVDSESWNGGGMTLREHYAGLALQSLIPIAATTEYVLTTREDVAAESVRYADALIAALADEPEEEAAPGPEHEFGADDLVILDNHRERYMGAGIGSIAQVTNLPRLPLPGCINIKWLYIVGGRDQHDGDYPVSLFRLLCKAADMPKPEEAPNVK